MSAYVSRTLAHRRASDRRNRIGARVAICAVLLMLALSSAGVCYMFLAYCDQIAAHTHDPSDRIAMLGILAGFVSFMSFLATPLVAAGLHE